MTGFRYFVVHTDGAVAQVAFYAGSTLIGVDTTSPYSATWSGPPSGQHALTAMATDDAGLSSTSAAVDVTVNPPSGNKPPVLDPVGSQAGDEGQRLRASTPFAGTVAWTPTEAQGPGHTPFTYGVKRRLRPSM